MVTSLKPISLATAILALIVSMPNSFAQSTYSLDDGTYELATGAFAGTPAAFLNRFQVSGGQSSITSIQIEWATFSNTNESVTAAVWSDPNQNSQPDDAILLGSSIATTSNYGSGFQNFDLQTPIDVGINGDYFFVGFYYDNTPSGDLFIGVDTSGSNQSFAVGNGPPFDPNNFTGYSQLSNLMIRATAMPEPSSLCLLGMSGLLLTLRRRR